MSKNRAQTISLAEDVLAGLKRVGVAVPIWDRPVSKEEIQYFLDRWMFLQVISSSPVTTLPEVQKVRAKTNWVILNYGDALASSPGEFLWGGGDFGVTPSTEEDEEGEGGGIVNPDKGTLWAQAYHTVAEMMALAKQFGWDGVHVVDGHPMMKWAAWMHAMDEGLSLSGFEPTEKDIARRERIKRSEAEDAKRFVLKP